MRFGGLGNAYNASHLPIKGFSRHRLNGVQKFNRDEHFLYLRQYDTCMKVCEQQVPANTKGHPATDIAQWDALNKLRRNSAMIPPSSDAHIKRRIRRLSIAAACGATFAFVAATTIGVLW